MTDLKNPTDLEDLFGPLYKFSEHKRGDVIRFRESELGVIEGTILWVIGPGPIASTQLAAHYIVDVPGHDWPETVFPSEVIADRRTTGEK